MPYILIRNTLTDTTRTVRVPEGTTFPADPAFRWAGFFSTAASARKALRQNGQADFWYDDTRPAVEDQLYAEPRGMNGTPGPEVVKELFRI